MPCSKGLLRLSLLVAPALLASVTATLASDKTDAEYENVAKALEQGEYGVSLRYRYERTDDDAFSRDAKASTLRTTLWYRSAGFRHLRTFLELEDITNLGFRDDHNDSRNGVGGRPLIADPPETEIHQATLAYGGLPGTELVLGRREILLDDERFVGSVGWRQNHQSFDSFLLTQTSIPRTGLTYAYVDNINTVTGANSGLRGHLANARVDLGDFGTAVGYYYSYDFDAQGRRSMSSGTVGASWSGEIEAGNYVLPFRIELAEQRDAGDNPTEIDAGYLRLELGPGRGDWGLKAGYEELEGSPDDGSFNTPLATLHKFNGWADKFGTTPPSGLRDLFLVGTWKSGNCNALLAWHRFDADTGGADYGHELDGSFVYTSPWKQTFELLFALFDADGEYTDTEKIWLMSRYAF